jgi:RNA polymerase sigma-70 factor (ECF subfamily)
MGSASDKVRAERRSEWRKIEAERLSDLQRWWAPGGMEVPAPAKVSGLNGNKSSETTFRRLYEAHYGAVLAYCLRRAGSADAYDAVSEVFLIAWRKIDDRPADDKVRAWLYGIAYRTLGHQWRSRRRYRRLERRIGGIAHLTEPGPEAVVVRRAEDRRVIEAAQRLRRTDQEILRLAGWEELPHADIATMLGISPAAVDQRFHRAKKRLAREYNRLEKRGEKRGAE